MSEQTTLGDLVKQGVLEFGDGYRTKRSEHGTPGIPILRVAEVLDGVINKTDSSDYISNSYRPAMGSKVSRPGDIVLTTKGTVGRVAIMPDDGSEFVYSPQLCYFRLNPLSGLQARYLYYWFKSDYFWSQAGSLKSQTDMADYLNLADIRSLRISIPPREAQERVVQVLGALDDKIAINDRIIAACHSLGDALFRSLRDSMSFKQRIGDLVARGELVFGDGYRTKRAEHGKPGIPILRVAEVLDGRIEASLEDCVSDQYRTAMGGKISRAGDVVLTTKGTVGRVAVIQSHDPEFVYSPQVCYFRIPEVGLLTSAYLFFWFRSGSFWSQAGSLKGQTDMADYLNLADIRSLSIEMPDSQESLMLLGKLGALEKMSAHRQRESRSLSILRDTLLPKLMSGEIRVRDAEKLVEDAT